MRRGRRSATSVLDRAVARWDARAYDGKLDALVDLSGNGLHARLGSAVGADTNDPLRLEKANAKYAYFPGSAGNSISTPRPVASVDYTITYSDGTTATNTSTADPLVFGTTDVQFAGLRVRSIQLNNTSGGALVGLIDIDLTSEPYASYTDAQGNVWTFNRSSTGRKLTVVDRDLLLLGADDYLEVADSPLLNFGAGGSATVCLFVRAYGATATESFIYKRDGSGGTLAGWLIRRATGTPTTLVAGFGDGDESIYAGGGTNLPVSGTASLLALVLNRSRATVNAAVNSVFQTATAASTLGSTSNTLPVRIGREAGAGGNYGAFELLGCAIFREALTADELVRLNGEMLL